MKLRNKKTGEIGYLHSDSDNQVRVARNSGYYYKYYNSLAELNEEWEDAPEEPKKYYYITSCGEVTHRGYRLWENESVYDKKRKEIGNYFDSREEAEKAVEKLKAWKRLKDKGFEFEYVEEYENLCGNGFEIPIMAIMPPENYSDIETVKDLNLLFSQEDD